jgi:pantoate--beta-alanine ligase
MIDLVKVKDELKEYLLQLRKEGKTIGFVPTMGALHSGHISLIKQCSSENDVCICSIFVNPTQFNDKEDFKRYPRILDDDLNSLEGSGCQIVFAPETDQIYENENPELLKIDLGHLNFVLEGAFRPGHYIGVITVVKKLFDIVNPDKAYFGQKDYQQFQVIKKMVETLALPVKLIMCDSVREEDGLAMSSRNTLLTQEERAFAPSIYKSLTTARDMLKNKPVEEIISWAKSYLCANRLVDFEYFEIVKTDLHPIISLEEETDVVICTALKVGKIRLIDNILVKLK